MSEACFGSLNWFVIMAVERTLGHEIATRTRIPPADVRCAERSSLEQANERDAIAPDDRTKSFNSLALLLRMLPNGVLHAQNPVFLDEATAAVVVHF
jgi:hypothetical protein